MPYSLLTDTVQILLNGVFTVVKIWRAEMWGSKMAETTR
jgi:hypothetical protein